jgi:hypothetical protein
LTQTGSVGQVEIAVPAHRHGLEIGGMRAGRVLAREGAGLVQTRGARFGDGLERLRAFGPAHVFAVVVELLADGAVQVVQLQRRVGRPGGTVEIALPAAQFVVDLVVADGSLGGPQFFDADPDDVARPGFQIGGVAWRRHGRGRIVALVVVCAAVAGRQGQGQEGGGQQAQQGLRTGAGEGGARRQEGGSHGPFLVYRSKSSRS